MEKEKSLKKNIFYSVLKSFLTIVFPIVTFPYAARILQPAGIGHVNFANSVVSYFVIISKLGIGGYACRELSKIKEFPEKASKFVKEIYSILAISTILAYILFFIAFFSIPKLSDYRQLLLILSIKILFTTFGIDWLFNAFEEFRYQTLRSFIFQAIGLAFLFICVRSSEDIIPYAIFGMITSVGCNAFNLFHSRKFINYRIKVKLNPLPHVKPVLIFWGMALVTSIYNTLDTTMLGFLSTDVQVGYYSAATKISHMVLTVLTAVSTVLMPRLSRYIVNGDKEKFESLSCKSFYIVLMLALPMAMGLSLLANPIILIFSGESFLPSINPMIVLTPIVIAIPLNGIMGGQVLPSMNKEKIALVSYITGAITNLTLNFLMIPKYGALGAAIGTLCAEFAVVLIQFFYLRKIFLKKEILLVLFQLLLSALIMSVVVYFVISLFDNIFLKILIAVITGVLTYSIMLFLLKNTYFMEAIDKVKDRISK